MEDSTALNGTTTTTRKVSMTTEELQAELKTLKGTIATLTESLSSMQETRLSDLQENSRVIAEYFKKIEEGQVMTMDKVKDMSPAEFLKQKDAIWRGAGKLTPKETPKPETPEEKADKEFAEKIRNMSPSDFLKQRDALFRQARTGIPEAV